MYIDFAWKINSEVHVVLYSMMTRKWMKKNVRFKAIREDVLNDNSMVVIAGLEGCWMTCVRELCWQYLEDFIPMKSAVSYTCNHNENIGSVYIYNSAVFYSH